jgi:hypothetical protein
MPPFAAWRGYGIASELLRRTPFTKSPPGGTQHMKRSIPMRKTTPLVILTALLIDPVTLLADDAKPDGDWRPLWDGKTLSGWHKIGFGEWKVVDGLLVGDHPNVKEDYGHLVSDKTYKDFTARVVFKAVKGNSGLYFRIRKEGFSGVTGFQAEIDASKDVGGLYETNGKGWVVQPKVEDVKKFFKSQAWNEMIIRAKGDRLQVWVNGMRTADIDYPQAKSKEGHFALQVHGGQAVQVMFKSIEILP